MKIDRSPRPTFSVDDARRATYSVFGIKGLAAELAGERDLGGLAPELDQAEVEHFDEVLVLVPSD